MATSSPFPRWMQTSVDRWNATTPSTKWRTVTVMLAGVAALVAISRWVSNPHWTPVYEQLTPATAGAMTRVLTADHIPYTLQSGGTVISVAQASVDQARVDLAEHNLPASNTALLPTPPTFSLGDTQTEVAAIQQTDLEDTLDRTIESIQGITAANVLITTPPTTLFGEGSAPATASVFIQQAPNTTLSRIQVQGIQHLVAAADTGLAPNQVSVINQAGTWLSNPTAPAANLATSPAATTTSQLDATNAVDQSLTSQVLNLLSPMFGPGNVVAQVQAKLNFTAQSTHTIRYTSRGTPTAQQIKTSATTTGAATTVTPPGAGTKSNIPTYPTATGTTGPSTGKSSDTITHYDVGQTVQSTTYPSGQITQLTVAVAINHPLSPQTIQAVRSLVMQSVGLTARQANAITVTGIPFNTQAAKQAILAAHLALKQAQAKQREEAMAGGGAALVVFLALLLATRKRKRPARLEVPDTPYEPPQPPPPPLPEPEDFLPEPDPNVPIRNQLRHIAETHPETIASVVRSMAEGDL